MELSIPRRLRLGRDVLPNLGWRAASIQQSVSLRIKGCFDLFFRVGCCRLDRVLPILPDIAGAGREGQNEPQSVCA